MNTGHFAQVIDDAFRRQQGASVKGERPGLEREEVMVAADIARTCKLGVEKQPTHQKEVGGVQHLLQSGGQPAVSLEEPELSQRPLLFLLSLLRERLLEGIAPLVRPILGRKMQLGEQAIAERLRQVVLELLDKCFFANQRQQLPPSPTEEALGGRRLCFEVQLQIR